MSNHTSFTRMFTDFILQRIYHGALVLENKWQERPQKPMTIHRITKRKVQSQLNRSFLKNSFKCLMPFKDFLLFFQRFLTILTTGIMVLVQTIDNPKEQTNDSPKNKENNHHCYISQHCKNTSDRFPLQKPTSA